MVEQRTHKPRVGGSTPSTATKFNPAGTENILCSFYPPKKPNLLNVQKNEWILVYITFLKGELS